LVLGAKLQWPARQRRRGQRQPRAGGGGGLEVSELGAGEGFNCVLAADGVVWCWGSNGSSQLGNGRTSNSFEPIAVHPEAL
jgi:alpha-tubulin suppressor-like RCC1 family protein